MPVLLDATATAPSSPSRPLPVGLGLTIGAACSLGLWAAIVATVVRLVG